MLLGANFIRNLQGGVRIEGNEVTFYTRGTKIQIAERVEVVQQAINELESNENEFLGIPNSTHLDVPNNKYLEERFSGTDPLRYWRRNKIIISEGKLKLQQHIIKRIVDFDEETLKTKKGMKSFLGVLNNARTHIPNLGTLLRPLYEKTSTGTGG
ncbi:hypothetical protein OSB04_018922 [Centaurea solstitialis]|uniref:Uncharacterized protein n=1 Tax=Centaurea solstitialis TaxID=347529 RepID=A0AA38WDQ6_9ASTR|nr:hypothetical protein OSB04_018922 [Centaurea solstitialis]